MRSPADTLFAYMRVLPFGHVAACAVPAARACCGGEEASAITAQVRNVTGIVGVGCFCGTTCFSSQDLLVT